MKPPLTPYARPQDLAPRDPQRLPAPVDGQLHLPPATFFFLGALCAAAAIALGAWLILALFF